MNRVGLLLAILSNTILFWTGQASLASTAQRHPALPALEERLPEEDLRKRLSVFLYYDIEDYLALGPD